MVQKPKFSHYSKCLFGSNLAVKMDFPLSQNKHIEKKKKFIEICEIMPRTEKGSVIAIWQFLPSLSAYPWLLLSCHLFPIMFSPMTFSSPLTPPSNTRRAPALLWGYAPSPWLPPMLGPAPASSNMFAMQTHCPASNPASECIFSEMPLTMWTRSDYRPTPWLHIFPLYPC